MPMCMQSAGPYEQTGHTTHGALIRPQVRNMQDMLREFDIVVNASGLGAAQLLGDKECFPARGQV